MPHELFLTTRQAIKIGNAFADDRLTDIKLSKVHLCKMIKPCGFFGSWLINSGEKALTNFAISLAIDSLPELVCNLASNAINKSER